MLFCHFLKHVSICSLMLIIAVPHCSIAGRKRRKYLCQCLISANNIAPNNNIIYCRRNSQAVVNVDCTNSFRCVVLMSSETHVVTISAIDEKQVLTTPYKQLEMMSMLIRPSTVR